MTIRRHEDYLEDLTEALVLRDVPPEVIGQVVREVESHLAESGEDPVDAFGPPVRYADEFAPRSRQWEIVWIAVAAALLGFGGGSMLISGAFGLIDPSVRLWGLAPWLRMSVGILGLAALVGLVACVAVRSRRRAATWRL